MTDSLNIPDSNDTPETVQPLITPETVTPTSFTPHQKTVGGFRGVIALLFIVGFAAVSIIVYTYLVNFVNDTSVLSEPVVELLNSPLIALLFIVGFAAVSIIVYTYLVNFVNDTSVLSETVVELLNSPLDDLETPVITSKGTLAIPVTEDSGLEIELDVQLADMIDLPDSATVTDAEGSVTHQDKDSNVVTPTLLPTVVDPPASK